MREERARGKLAELLRVPALWDRILSTVTKRLSQRKTRQGGMRLFQVVADEADGEHKRLIEFVVWARTQSAAERKALYDLRREWGTADRDQIVESCVASFFGGQIVITDMAVYPTTVREVIERQTHGKCYLEVDDAS